MTVSSCITILKYAGNQFAVCQLNDEIIPKRELNSHCLKCNGSNSDPGAASHDPALLNDDISPIMTLQRLFQTEVINWQVHESKRTPLLPKLTPNTDETATSENDHRTVCKLCLADTNQVIYTRESSDRLAHLQTFHPKIYATFGANIRDLNAQFNGATNTLLRRRDSESTSRAAKEKLASALKSVDIEIERDYFFNVSVVKLRDGGADRGVGDWIRFPTVLA